MQEDNRQYILFSKDDSASNHDKLGKLLKKYPYSLNLQYKYLESATKLGLHVDRLEFKRLSAYAIDTPFFKLKFRRLNNGTDIKKVERPTPNAIVTEDEVEIKEIEVDISSPAPPANLINDISVKQDTNEHIDMMAQKNDLEKSADQAPESTQFTEWLEGLKKSKRLKEASGITAPVNPEVFTTKKKKKKKKKKSKKRKKLLEFGSKQEDIISETLAELMAKQGYTDKAIEMYNRLSLLFPDKNAYFARKIEELQK